MSDRNESVLRRMMVKGKDYREEFELEYMGEEATLQLKPLEDQLFLDLLEELDEVIEDDELQEQLDDIDEDEEMPDEGEFSSEFVSVLQEAAKKGIDPEPFGEDEEFIDEFVESLVGGKSIEIGAEVMDITSNLQDAERFR